MEMQNQEKPGIRMKEWKGADTYCPVHAELVRRRLQINDVEVALCDKCMTELKECVYAEVYRDEEIREVGERDAIRKALNKAFPGHLVIFCDDPDDEGTTLVRLYDIPDDSVLTAREKVRELIRKLEDDNQIREMRYLASIVSHSNIVRSPELLCQHEERGYAR